MWLDSGYDLQHTYYPFDKVLGLINLLEKNGKFIKSEHIKADSTKLFFSAKSSSNKLSDMNFTVVLINNNVQRVVIRNRLHFRSNTSMRNQSKVCLEIKRVALLDFSLTLAFNLECCRYYQCKVHLS